MKCWIELRRYIFVDDEDFQADIGKGMIQRVLSRKADRRNKTAEAG
jgi:hypothetical protein